MTPLNFIGKTLRLQQTLGGSEPSLPQKWQRDSKLVQVKVSFHIPQKLSFAVEYMEAMDLVINFIREHFNQPGYRIYCNLENLLLKAASKDNYTAELQFVLDYYGNYNLIIII